MCRQTYTSANNRAASYCPFIHLQQAIIRLKRWNHSLLQRVHIAADPIPMFSGEIFEHSL